MRLSVCIKYLPHPKANIGKVLLLTYFAKNLQNSPVEVCSCLHGLFSKGVLTILCQFYANSSINHFVNASLMTLKIFCVKFLRPDPFYHKILVLLNFFKKNEDIKTVICWENNNRVLCGLDSIWLNTKPKNEEWMKKKKVNKNSTNFF